MIDAYAFGKITINGTIYTSDLKILRGEIIPSWWRKTGHEVVADDISDILNAKPDILVIGKGDPGQMKTTASLQRCLEASGIHLIEEPTHKAVETFNRLYKEKKYVAAGFHLTC